MKKLFMLLLVAFAALCCVSCSDDDDDKNKDFPTEDPTDPNIVRTITLTIKMSYPGNTIEFGFSAYFQDSTIGRIPFPKDLSIDWGDGSITHSNSHKYEVAGIYNIIISAKDLRYFSYEDDHDLITNIDFKKCNSLVGLHLEDQALYEIDVAGFTELKYMYISGDNYLDRRFLRTLNVDGCTTLTKLYCHENNLTSLDVSKCTALTELDCSFNELTSLDVSGCTALTELDCHENNLTSLDVSKCTALTELDCHENNLTSLDVSKCTALTELDCSSNNLTSLDVSKNTALTRLKCWGNNLTSLDVSKCTALTELDCSSNNLTSLDVSKCTALTELDCSSNNLTSAALNQIFRDLPQVTSGTIYMSGNPGTETCDKNIAENKGWYLQ